MNIQLKKFYDPAVAEPAASPTEGMSIAAMMAKHGVSNNTDQMVATPIVITPEKKEEPAASEPPATATVAQPPTTVPATPEPPTPTEPAAATPPAIPVEPPKVPTWQEVLKQQQPDAIFKELGVNEQVVNLVKELREADPKMLAFLSKWKAGEDLKPYLRELVTDYKSMSPEDVMRHKLQADYPGASQQQIDALYKRQVVKAYSLDSEDEDEKNEGLLLLQADSEKHRAELVSKQQDYLFPKPPEPKAPEPDLQAQESERSFQAYQSHINDSPYTKNIFANKQLVIGEGEEQFKFTVDPAAITEMFFDDEKWASNLFQINEKPGGGKDYIPDIEKHYLVGAVMKYGKTFLDAYAQHFKTIGGKAIIAPLENATIPSGATPAGVPAEPKTPAEAMARQGTLNPGGGYR